MIYLFSSVASPLQFDISYIDLLKTAYTAADFFHFKIETHCHCSLICGCSPTIFTRSQKSYSVLQTKTEFISLAIYCLLLKLDF